MPSRRVTRVFDELVEPLSEWHCQIDEKLVDRPPRYWAPARREPAMLGIKNGRQPQLDNTPGGPLLAFWWTPTMTSTHGGKR